MRNRILAVICTAICIFIIVFLVNGAFSFQRGIGFTKDGFDEFSAEISRYESQKKNAEKNLLYLEKQVDSVEKKTTLTLAFCGMSEDIYNLAFPLMQEYGMVGTVVMTGDRLPGGEGLLSDSQIYELVNAGWRLIPGWTDGDGDNGISSTSKWIMDYGYDFEGAVFIDPAALTPEYESLILSEGYGTVISDIGFGTTADVTSNEVGDLWNIPAMGYKSIGPKGILNEALGIFGNLVFTVDFESEDSLFDHATLVSMLDYLKSCSEKGYLSVLTPAAAREYRSDMDARIAAAVEGIASEKAENERLITEAEVAITSLYDEYYSGK